MAALRVVAGLQERAERVLQEEKARARLSWHICHR